jgi:hypothetical protein
MSTNAALCEWLHGSLDALPVFSYPFDVAALPSNGIYFFYEKGEHCGHGAGKPRIVRVGTHRNGNFRSRISEHFLLNERKMEFTQEQQRPHDRSIVRCHIGRVLLNKARDPYLSVWAMDFTKRVTRDTKRHLLDIGKEVTTEREVTRILREDFSFRFIEIADQIHRMGKKGLEGALIGTLARCPQCTPSDGWLGLAHPSVKIRESGLWLVQHLKDAPLSCVQMDLITAAIERSTSRA